jgi:hypothetical protein
MAIALRKREFVHVLPEVIEVIERNWVRGKDEITLIDVSLELCVHPVVTQSIFTHLEYTGLICKIDTSTTCLIPYIKTLLTNDIYKILRGVTQKDYGQNVESEKEKVVYQTCSQG